MIKVSIIIPAYNCIELVDKALNSIPVRDDIEVIIVDDNSDDGTYERILAYKYRHPFEVIVIRNKTNLGCALATNTALDNASGEYIVQLDIDDYLYTRVFTNIIDKDLWADIVYFDMDINDGSIWCSSENTTFSIVDHCSFIKRDLIGGYRKPEVKYGGGLYLNEYIQNELKKRNGTVIYTHKLAYHYNYPRIGSVMDKVHKGELK